MARGALLTVFLAVLLILAVGLKPPVSEASAAKEGKDPLVLGILPYLASSEIIKRFSPLADYLAKHTGRPVRILVAVDYSDHVANVGLGKVDIAYMGPSPYIFAVDAYGRIPILGVTEVNGEKHFKGVVIKRTDSPIMKLKDLKGRSFAFCDPDSTMGHHVPRYMMMKDGVAIEDLGHYEFLENHNNVALGVLMGNFDAGAVKEDIFEKYRSRGLEALAYTPDISAHLFVARRDLPRNDISRIRSALMELSDTPEGMKILSSIKQNITGIVPADDAEYDGLREILRYLRKSGVFK